MTDRSVLAIGYGNSLRRDDGAGLILAAALVRAWQADNLPASLITDHQLNPELAVDIAQGDTSIVLFVDAVDATTPVSASDLQSAEIVETRLAPLARGGPSPSLGHHLTPEAVLVYARELFQWKGSGWTISIPGFDFDHGDGLSTRTEHLVQEYLSGADEVWQRIQRPMG